MIRIIVAGSRSITDYQVVKTAIEQAVEYLNLSPEQIEIVSGCARGADFLGQQWAAQNDIRVSYMPADWQGYGTKAGPIRNEQMACYAQALVLIWDGLSPGSRDMLNRAKAHNLTVFQHVI